MNLSENNKLVYFCPNPMNTKNCFGQINVRNKYHLKQLNDNKTCCKVCANLKMVETRKSNGTYNVTDVMRKNISDGLKKVYANGERTTWNKGLSAKIDSRVAKTGKSRPGKDNPMYGRSYKDIWRDQLSDAEFDEKMDYNSYLKSQSSLSFDDWIILRGQNKTAFGDYKREVWNYTIKNPLNTLPNFDKRGRTGVVGAYHLDHIISIKHGFERNIDPSHIGSMDNLWFIPWEINLRKAQKDSWKFDFSAYYPYTQYDGNLYNMVHIYMYDRWNIPSPKLKKIVK